MDIYEFGRSLPCGAIGFGREMEIIFRYYIDDDRCVDFFRGLCHYGPPRTENAIKAYNLMSDTQRAIIKQYLEKNPSNQNTAILQKI